MSIRFSCTSCGQRLSVGTHRAGQQSTCPKCKATLQIPAAASEASSPAVPKAPVKPPMAMVALSDDPPEEYEQPTEIVYEQPAAAMQLNAKRRTKTNAEADLDLIAVPRYVVFAQGFLLAFVGILCFLLGLAVGGAITQANPNKANTESWQVTGTVSLLERGKRSGDVGAMIVLLPTDAIPETKGTMIGLRPGDAAEAPKALEFIKSCGGATAKCDERGRFEVQVPRRGKYYLLVISSTGSLRGPAVVSQQQLGQMGKFFDMASEPLDKFRYQWRVENIRNDAPLTIDFD